MKPTTVRRPTSLRARTGSATRLAMALRAVAGRPVGEVRITPATYDNGAVWCVLLLDGDLREIPAPGRTADIATLLRAEFPDAHWGRAQNYSVPTGVLTEHEMPRPPGTACRTPGMRLSQVPAPHSGHAAVAARARQAVGQWVYGQHCATRGAASKVASQVRLAQIAVYSPTGHFAADVTPDTEGASVWVRYVGPDSPPRAREATAS